MPDTFLEELKAKGELFEEAKAILRKNWVDLGNGEGYTKPSAGIYPLQWNWDSSFAVYGYSHYDIDRAITELRTLFNGQWTNGFLPHIIFHNSEDYFPGADFWGAQNVSDKAPKNVDTSGITQPPIHAMGIWHIYKRLKMENEKKARQFLNEFYPKLYRLHKYLYTNRDPEGWGLITIYHPWESGFDNSPRWDEPLENIIPKDIPKYKRTDIKFIDPLLRPSNKNYDRYVYLALELKKKKYDDDLIYKEFPFKIKDKMFSSILYFSNKRLKKMAEELGEDMKQIDEWMKKFEDNLTSKLWDDTDKLFYDYDLNKNKQIKVKTIGALLPFITGILSKAQLEIIFASLDRANFCGEKSCAVELIPSTGIGEKYFNERLYWRGPIWINVNWFLWKGFKEYGMVERAKHFQTHILRLVAENGFWEHYSPLSGKGMGAKNFSWTAALVIDLLHD